MVDIKKLIDTALLLPVEERLDFDFALEVYSSIQKILDFPCAWPIIDKGIRRSLLNRFP